MIKGVHSVGLAAADVERSVAAYQAAVPLERLDGPGVLLRGPNVHLEVTPAGPAKGPRPVHQAGLAHVCVQGREMAPLRQALEGGGVAFLSEPVDLGTGFLYAYGRDADGVLLETEGAPFAPAEPRAWFGHVAFVTPDLDRLCGFYAVLLGRPHARGPRLKGSRRYDAVTGLAEVDVTAAWVPGGSLSLEFWRYDNPAVLPREEAAGRPGWTHLTLESDDVDGDLGRAVELGGTPAEAPQDGPYGRTAAFRDPDGNLIRLARWALHARRLSIDALPHPDMSHRVQQAREAAAA